MLTSTMAFTCTYMNRQFASKHNIWNVKQLNGMQPNSISVSVLPLGHVQMSWVEKCPLFHSEGQTDPVIQTEHVITKSSCVGVDKVSYATNQTYEIN